MKDWKGNAKSTFVTLGASNHTDNEREQNDYYATEPKAVELLLELEDFSTFIWECACGEGHMSEALKKAGYIVKSSDIIDRGYEGTEVIDFLKAQSPNIPHDIITNPPYKYAKEFVEHALEISTDGTKIAMFLKLTFCESSNRKDLFKNNPPLTVYVSSSRLQCGKNGVFEGSSAACYAWFIWKKGYQGPTYLRWFN